LNLSSREHSDLKTNKKKSSFFLSLPGPRHGIENLAFLDVGIFQCSGSESGSGSTGSTCFWASWIRIRLRVWILLSLSKNSKENLDFYLQKEICRKTLLKKLFFDWNLEGQ
jgi:hypothetical protein